jgi:hypothetical protein
VRLWDIRKKGYSLHQNGLSPQTITHTWQFAVQKQQKATPCVHMGSLLPSQLLQLATLPKSGNGKLFITAVVTTAAATVAAAALLHRLRGSQNKCKLHQTEAKGEEAVVPDRHVKLQLSQWETNVMWAPATATATFYKGVSLSCILSIILSVAAPYYSTT